MANIGLPKESEKRLKVREMSVKSQGILKWILSGNPDEGNDTRSKRHDMFSYWIYRYKESGVTQW